MNSSAVSSSGQKSPNRSSKLETRRTPCSCASCSSSVLEWKSGDQSCKSSPGDISHLRKQRSVCFPSLDRRTLQLPRLGTKEDSHALLRPMVGLHVPDGLLEESRDLLQGFVHTILVNCADLFEDRPQRDRFVYPQPRRGFVGAIFSS